MMFKYIYNMGKKLHLSDDMHSFWRWMHKPLAKKQVIIMYILWLIGLILVCVY